MRWFLALAETGHVTETAARLHIDQSTLSRALRRLERGVGTALFDRERQRLRLNDYGRVFRRHAQRALDELDAAQGRIAALLEPPRDTLALGFAHSLGSWLVPRLVGGYQREVPDAGFTLHPQAAENLPGLLLEGAVDAAVTSPRPSDRRIGWLPLCDEPLRLAVPAGHPLAGRAEVRLAELADERLIIMGRALGLRQITCQIFHRAGVTPAVTAESGEVATIVSLVAAGVGISVVPAGDGAPPPAGVRLVPLAEHDAYRPVGLAWHADRAPSLAGRRFREFVTRYAPRLADPDHSGPAEDSSYSLVPPSSSGIRRWAAGRESQRSA
nr:LysR family transcriptional regulator [Streptomyces sp. SID5468]